MFTITYSLVLVRVDAARLSKKTGTAGLSAAHAVAIGTNVASKSANTAHVEGLNVNTCSEYADNAAAVKSIKDAFNKLALQWNKKNPKAKVALLK